MKRSKPKSAVKRTIPRDLLFYGVAALLVAAGLFWQQKQADDQKRADSILAEREILQSQAEEAVEKPCAETGVSHQIVFANGAVAPTTLSVKKCDVIVLSNQETSDQVYNMNFGDHDNHLNYLNYSAKDLAPGETQSFVATTVGTYLFHDHYKDVAHIDLTVSE